MCTIADHFLYAKTMFCDALRISYSHSNWQCTPTNLSQHSTMADHLRHSDHAGWTATTQWTPWNTCLLSHDSFGCDRTNEIGLPARLPRKKWAKCVFFVHFYMVNGWIPIRGIYCSYISAVTEVVQSQKSMNKPLAIYSYSIHMTTEVGKIDMARNADIGGDV